MGRIINIKDFGAMGDGLLCTDAVNRAISSLAENGGTEEDAERHVAEDDFRYPEQWFFGVLPAYAVFARHVKGLWMNNVWVDAIEKDAREACICEDVQDAKYFNCTFSVKGEAVE